MCFLKASSALVIRILLLKVGKIIRGYNVVPAQWTVTFLLEPGLDARMMKFVAAGLQRHQGGPEKVGKILLHFTLLIIREMT
jgi:hypothetical protein